MNKIVRKERRTFGARSRALTEGYLEECRNYWEALVMPGRGQWQSDAFELLETQLYGLAVYMEDASPVAIAEYSIILSLAAAYLWDHPDVPRDELYRIALRDFQTFKNASKLYRSNNLYTCWEETIIVRARICIARSCSQIK